MVTANTRTQASLWRATAETCGRRNKYEELGARKYTVIYGDTDSVFVQLKDDRDPHKLAEELSARGLEMELEKILETFLNSD